MSHKVLVTGGAGFIGSNFVRLLITQPDIEKVVILDKLTYAGSLDNLEGVLDDPRITFIKGDIAEPDDAVRAMKGCDWVINFAAESHVDRSINDPAPFMRTKVEGVRVHLEVARELKPKIFLQVSTDEVYGPIIEGCVDESAPLKPSSPYSASKAAADMLCNAYYVTFGVPVIIARSANNSGPYQYPEKLIPRFVSLALMDEPLPIYGDGLHMRDWLYVEDNCRALLLLLRKGKLGEIYNIGASEIKHNIDVAKLLLDILGKPHSLIKHVDDRPGHDRRYCVDWSKIKALGW
ncbi:dTDP-glucose 4,6-dehydratase, partial [bacterium]